MTPFTGEDAATHRGQALISYVPVTNLCGKEGHGISASDPPEDEASGELTEATQTSHCLEGNVGRQSLSKGLTGACPELAPWGHGGTQEQEMEALLCDIQVKWTSNSR